MSDSNSTISYTTPENFDDITSPLLKNGFEEFQKISSYFSKVIETSGPDSFSTTVLVFNRLKQRVGLVASRPVDDKEDMYKALAQMLYWPMTLGAELFIVVQDSRITLLQENNRKQDALVTSFVTPSNCVIFTLPYTVNSSNNVVYDFSTSWISNIDESYKKQGSSVVGDMVELFYLFSHTNTTGPFLPHEVLAFFQANGFPYEVTNHENMHDSFISLPIAL